MLLSRAIKVIFLLILLAFLAYVGTCAYANFIAKPEFSPFGPKAPEAQDAPYYVLIENTGNVLFTESYDQYGNVFVLHGFWEVVGHEFKYRKRDLIIDQAIFGQVTVRSR